MLCVLLFRSPVLLYSGGMPRASYGDRHCLTIQQDKDHVTLDFTSRVIDFFTVHSIEQTDGEELASGNDVYLLIYDGVFFPFDLSSGFWSPPLKHLTLLQTLMIRLRW